MSAIRKIWALLRKDLAMELRSLEMLSSMFVFSLIVVLVFSFSFDLRVSDSRKVAPGILWVAFSFAGMLGLGRSFVSERDEGCLDGLLLCPVDRSVIYLGKLMSNLVFISIVEAITFPIFVALFNLPILPMLLPIIFLGTLGFAAVGTLFAAMSVHAQAREVLLPVLVFPIVIPALIAAVKLTAGVIDGQPWSEMVGWFRFLCGFDVLFLVIPYMVFEYVVEE